MAVRVQRSEREDGDGEWQSEGVQLGGLGSATGVIGMWTGADHERMDPLGEQLAFIPACFWTPDAVAPFRSLCLSLFSHARSVRLRSLLGMESRARGRLR